MLDSASKTVRIASKMQRHALRHTYPTVNVNNLYLNLPKFSQSLGRDSPLQDISVTFMQ